MLSFFASLLSFILRIWNAWQDEKLKQQGRDEVTDAIDESSHAEADAAVSRTDPALHGVPDVVQPDKLPGWLRGLR